MTRRTSSQDPSASKLGVEEPDIEDIEEVEIWMEERMIGFESGRQGL